MAGETYHSCITLGTAQLGFDYGIANRTGCPGDAQVQRILNAAHRAGISHLDTARAYGNSEVRIGQLEPQYAANRFHVVTKLQPLTDLPDNASSREVCHAVDVSVNGSCRDLHRDYIDVIMFHRSTDIFRWQGAALARLSEYLGNGVVGAIGVSVYTPEEAIHCLADSLITHIQLPFNLVDSRWLKPDFQKVLEARSDVKVHVRSVFLQGLLLSSAKVWPEWVKNAREQVDCLETLCKVLRRESRADLCMAYVRAFPWVTSLVLGVETVTQLDGLLMLAHKPPLIENEILQVNQSLESVPERLLNPSMW
jgi:aryl-alcohol dehydrogenase-like predicted oxidoreductase